MTVMLTVDNRACEKDLSIEVKLKMEVHLNGVETLFKTKNIKTIEKDIICVKGSPIHAKQ